MNLQRRDLFLVVILAAAAAIPAWGQDAAPAVGPARNSAQSPAIPHAAQVTPSWHGDSVGHYEGDTLVIDTVGVKVDRYSMIDRFGTPHTEAMRVIERYQPLDYEAAKAAQQRGQKEWPRIPSYPIDLNYKGKGLQLQFTVEDDGVFTMPWTATITYRRASHTAWEEFVCAENIQQCYAGHQYYSENDAMVPTADKPDF